MNALLLDWLVLLAATTSTAPSAETQKRLQKQPNNQVDAPSLGQLVPLAAIASTAPSAETQKRLHMQFDKQCFLTWMAVEISGSFFYLQFSYYYE